MRLEIYKIFVQDAGGSIDNRHHLFLKEALSWTNS
jgi:hypothetical protein